MFIKNTLTNKKDRLKEMYNIIKVSQKLHVYYMYIDIKKTLTSL